MDNRRASLILGCFSFPRDLGDHHRFFTLTRRFAPWLILRSFAGSVTPETVDELMAKPDIDGALVGGASLVAEKFSRIINFEEAKVSA